MMAIRIMFFSICLAVIGVGESFGQFSITVLHNNDGESQVVNAGDGLEDFGGIARFATLVEDTRSFYEGIGHGVLTISSGDNFLAGPEFEASFVDGVFYDALAISEIGYDAVVIGNHEFDFGPVVLSDFIIEAQNSNPTVFVSSNLDFSGEPGLQARVNAEQLASSVLVEVATDDGAKNIGIIGATTENLPFISSTGNVVVGSVADAVNQEILALQMAGADLIILASHLQGIDEDQMLVPLLNEGVDLIIAGGGDDRLASVAAPSPSTVYGMGAPDSIIDSGLIPGDSSDGPYPTISTGMDKGGNNIPIVSTDANYKYVGRITLNVDAMGIVTVDPTSNPQQVNSSFIPNPTIQTNTVDPVAAFVMQLDQIVIGTTNGLIVGGASSDLIRSGERAGGNLVADAFFAKATELAGQFEVGNPDMTITNGGGIRADIAGGDISILDTFNIAPFGNFVTIVEGVTSADLKLLLENAYSKTVDGPEPGIDPIRQGDGTGRFAHVSGISITYDIFADPLVLDGDGNIIQQGERILEVILDDGTRIISGGQVCEERTFNIATVIFLATGGDQYFGPYLSQNYGFASLGTTDQQAVEDYISGFGGPIDDDKRYDPEPDGRIVATTTSVAGDINRDGVVDLSDVDPFVDVVLQGCFQVEADTNLDTEVNLLDVQPFIDLVLE